MSVNDILQLIASGVESLSNSSDAFINAESQRSRETEARLTVKRTYSYMLKKTIELDQTKEDVIKEIQIYWVPKKQFESWLRKVDTVKPEVQELARECAMANDLASWLTVSRVIELTCTKIDGLTAQGTDLMDVLRKRYTRHVVKLSPSLNITKISALQSKVDLILKQLTEGSTNAINLCGHVGSGKRTILEQS